MSNSNQRQSVESFNRDLLSKMTDPEVGEAMVQFRNRIELCTRRGENTKLLETEFCYIQDEVQRRAKYSPFFSHHVASSTLPEA